MQLNNDKEELRTEITLSLGLYRCTSLAWVEVQASKALNYHILKSHLQSPALMRESSVIGSVSEHFPCEIGSVSICLYPPERTIFPPELLPLELGRLRGPITFLRTWFETHGTCCVLRMSSYSPIRRMLSIKRRAFLRAEF